MALGNAAAEATVRCVCYVIVDNAIADGSVTPEQSATPGCNQVISSYIACYGAVGDGSVTVIKAAAASSCQVVRYGAAGDRAVAIIQPAAKATSGIVTGGIVADCTITYWAVAAMQTRSFCRCRGPDSISCDGAIRNRPITVKQSSPSPVCTAPMPPALKPVPERLFTGMWRMVWWRSIRLDASDASSVFGSVLMERRDSMNRANWNYALCVLRG